MKDIIAALPRVISAHVDAHNAPDPDALMATFAEDALLNDARREFLGLDAIRRWADKEIFGDNVRIQVVRAYEHHGAYIIHAKFDGDFDKANLPDPLILTCYFNLTDEKITQLVILRNASSWPDMPY
jgi:hypothetical protein